MGNLKRYVLEENRTVARVQETKKTRDTNCQMLKQFSSVKHFILNKEKNLRAGTFITKMYGSLQASYMVHIVEHKLSQKLLLNLMPSKDMNHLHETWTKEKGDKTPAKKSRFCSAPQPMPFP